ncbi:hypothetical protein QCA50_006477 [Cerrena zonata]|uniref:Integral membrane protein n=1 Tax=Cerrena zonata TaxID=2478898 RepID=A0AAW0GHW7_9APHY
MYVRPKPTCLRPGPQKCDHFVRYEGSMTVIGLNTTALMMFLRVYALYPRHYGILAFVLLVFAIELGVNAWLLSHGAAVRHNTPIHACTMIFDDSVKRFSSASAYLPLLYDTVVVLLTLNRTLSHIRKRTASKIMRVLLRDGLLYYSVIFAINLVLTIMIAAAPPGLQNVTAQLTVAMMSRITLHLKKQGRLNTVTSDDKWSIQTIGQSLGGFFPSQLRFARTNKGATGSAGNHHPNPEVTVTIEELVTRDDDLSPESDLDDTDRSKGGSSILPHHFEHHPGRDDGAKRAEWHEMHSMR